MTSKIGNERERNKTKWNGTSSKGEKIRSVPRTMKISSVSSFWKRRSQCFFFFLLFSFFFPRHCLPKPRRNQFNRQIIGIPEPGNFSRTDSTRCGSIKLEASPFLSLGDRFLSGKGGEEEEEEEENRRRWRESPPE